MEEVSSSLAQIHILSIRYQDFLHRHDSTSCEILSHEEHNTYVAESRCQQNINMKSDIVELLGKEKFFKIKLIENG